MTKPYEMTVTEIFRFRDGRVVLVGEVEQHDGYIKRGRFEVRQEGELCGLLDIEGEMIANRSGEVPPNRLRSVSNTSASFLNREYLGKGPLVLKRRDPCQGDEVKKRLHEGKESQMHRHLLGIDSPPPEFLADPMTQGPVLPEGWDGDAWEGPRGHGAFLRAWHTSTGRVAYGRGSSYEEARSMLLDDVWNGSRRVEIRPIETTSVHDDRAAPSQSS